ncbi:MAG: Asp-tRNA(Asn)/Glu-tRNA(Gln) amidotransferase subunit GatB [Candidatus Nealsonbacteria bacterium]|nr:Asp-tRNA(Asn)/Glu-tRNA(Gln) amidotransferase subunit GatB [Candidatus Nealsonbacteria bacterium]
MEFKPVIGLEIHIELKTNSKMFCGCSARHFGEEPNTHCCPVCLGLPGALPFPNKKAIEWTIRLGLVLNCQVSEESKFDRKNYFYPDLPKGYQISQYDQPFCREGKVTLKDGREIRLRRVHLEEDTGKLVHLRIDGQDASLVDFNRSGVPLVEVVTEPDFQNSEEVDEFLKSLQRTVRYLDVSDADMEKGSMRLEPNISLQLPGQNELPDYKVEVKNINSFRFVRKAIEYEIARQTGVLQKGEKLIQETRGWSESENKTFSQREKEEAHDYRYFPEPDIPPLSFGPEEVEEIRQQIPELPEAKRQRFQREFKLSPYQTDRLIETKELADYYEAALGVNGQIDGKKYSSPSEVANWLINRKIDIKTISPERMIKDLIASKEVTRLGEGEMSRIVNEVLAENAQAAEDYKKGKTAVLGFLIGQVVKKIGPQADRQEITRKLQEKLG